jgi:predicted PurR-regulated permease PerM
MPESGQSAGGWLLIGANAGLATNRAVGGYIGNFSENEGAVADLAAKADLRAIEKKGDRARERKVVVEPEIEPGEEGFDWQGASRLAIIGIFVGLLICALELARGMLVPVVAAFVLGLMLGPLTKRARAWGLPPIVVTIVLWLLVVAVFNMIIVMLSAPVVDLISKGPNVIDTLRDKIHIIDRPLAAMQSLREALLPQSKEPALNVDLLAFLQPAVSLVTPAIGQVVIFFGTFFFVLLGHARMRRSLVFFFSERAERLRALRILDEAERSLTSYLSVVTVINLAMGTGAVIIAYACGLPGAPAWGVLAFVLNYIPYLGALTMEIILLAVGLVTFPTLGHAVVAPLAYLAMGTLEGHFITPSIIGKRFTLNPLTVFLALVFWTWLWGPAGALLSMPLLVMSQVVARNLWPKDKPALPG